MTRVILNGTTVKKSYDREVAINILRDSKESGFFSSVSWESDTELESLYIQACLGWGNPARKEK